MFYRVRRSLSFKGFGFFEFFEEAFARFASCFTHG
jgi:hypothetical protein